MKPGVVYLIRCVANGRVYVGSTTKANPRQRWLEHLHGLRHGKHHSKHLQRVFDKHGEGSLAFSVVEQVRDGDRLLEREQEHIDAHGDVMNSAPVSDSHLAAAAANRGRIMSAEERARRAKAQTGIVRRPWSVEQRAAHSIRLTGRKMPPVAASTGAAISAAKRGKKMTAAHREAVRASRHANLLARIEPCRAMRAEGMSFRAIERATGISRDVLARELR